MGETVTIRLTEPGDADGYLAMFEAIAAEGRWIGTELPIVDRGHSHLGMGLVAGFRGQGLGPKLLAECIAWSREYGAHKIDLEVWPHNTAARQLYERAGFVVEGRRRRHWRRNSGELWDSIEMSLMLDETSPGSPHEADG